MWLRKYQTTPRATPWQTRPAPCGKPGLRRRALVSTAVILLALPWMPTKAAGLPRSKPRLIHAEPSQYETVIVLEQYGERCMNFIRSEEHTSELQSRGQLVCRPL